MAAAKKKKKTKQKRTRWLRQKRTRKAQRRAKARLKRRLARKPLDDYRFVVNPKGQVKMSEVLEEFVEPYRKEMDDTLEAARKLFTLAILAWNATLLPEEERQGMVERVLDGGLAGISEEARQGLGEFVAELIERKLAYFAENKRIIIDFELIDIGDSYHLTVVSTVDSSYAEQASSQ